MSLNEPWGHYIDGWATIQMSPTALTINLDPGYVFGSTPLSKWIGVKEGNFLEHLQALGASSKHASWVTIGFWRVQPPFFIVPSFAFKLTFLVVLLRSSRQCFTRCSGLPHLKQFQFFLWYSLTVLAKWMTNPTDWSDSPTPLKVPGSSTSEDLTSSASSFVPKPSAILPLSTIVDLTMKVWLPFNVWEGNKFPDFCEKGTFDPPVGVVFGSRGSLASAHLSNFWAARSRSEYLVGCLPSTLWVNICCYLGFRPL